MSGDGGSRPNRKPGRRIALLASWGFDLIWVLLCIILSPVLAVLLASKPKLRRGLTDKFVGFPSRSDARPALWFHAVSVGEVLIAETLIRRAAERFPDLECVLSVSTYTGREVAERRLGNEVSIFYAPVEFSWSQACAFRRIRPALIVLIELELWPTWLLQSAGRGVPVVVANGRLSERSYRGYRRLGFLGRWLFSGVESYAAQNEEYAARFRGLVDADRVKVLGNVKYDRDPPPDSSTADALRGQLGWGDSEFVVVAGCTHPGEERALAEMLPRLREQNPQIRLVVAPRHVERLVEGEIESWGFAEPVRWSELDSKVGERTLVVDTIGELESFYSVSDLAIVGGSFVDHGGHNMLEPTRLGKPTVFGPYDRNFAAEAAVLLEAGAARRLMDFDALESSVLEFARDPELGASLGSRGADTVASLRGALERHIEWIAAIAER